MCFNEDFELIKAVFCPAFFSQVAVLAAVLALVVIAIISIIILIAVWRKVSDLTSCLSVWDLAFRFNITEL